jgi:hypothetical protein
MQQVIKKYAMSWPSSMHVGVQTTTQPLQQVVAPPDSRSATLTPDELLDLRHNWPQPTAVKEIALSLAASTCEQSPSARPVLEPSFREAATGRSSWISPLGWAMLILFLLAFLFYLSV